MSFLYFENFDLSLTNVKLSADVAEINKDDEGHIGIAIGGGAPFCSCLYVAQVFEGSPVDNDKRLHPGDEILAINKISVKGSDKTTVAKLIRQSSNPIKISFNKLCFDLDQGQTFDIALKKLKHWFVESMDDKTADALGLSRATLRNDLLSQLIEKLEMNAQFYNSLAKKCREITKIYQQIALAQDEIGSAFSEIATREPLNESKFLFSAISECHRDFKKEQLSLALKIESVIDKIQVYVDKAIPDTKSSIKKYMDIKFEYLAFCLKIKEMEDEETTLIKDGDYLPRLENGNMEYRIILHCREKSRKKFIDIRKHVMVKIEILDEKHVRELALHLITLINAFCHNAVQCRQIVEKASADSTFDESKKNESSPVIDSIKTECILNLTD